MTLAWNDIERITGGKLGRKMALCPICSEQRRTPQKRHSKVLAVTLLEPEFAVYYCNHCEAQGHCRPDAPERVIVNLAEQQRRRAETDRHATEEKQQRTQRALKLWDEAGPCRGSPIEDYFYHTRAIGDWFDSFPYLDEVFRYHVNCPFGGERLPCMLALVRDIRTDAPLAIHRTALTTDQRPKKIDRKSLGPLSGGAIKISPDHEVHSGLLIAEGIETAFSASKLLSFKPVWSVIDKNGIAKFPVLSGIESVTVAVDNDLDGQQAAATLVDRLTAANVEVITIKTNIASDFNDLDLARAVR
jgi:putative DNA primase/helicase